MAAVDTTNIGISLYLLNNPQMILYILWCDDVRCTVCIVLNQHACKRIVTGNKQRYRSIQFLLCNLYLMYIYIHCMFVPLILLVGVPFVYLLLLRLMLLLLLLSFAVVPNSMNKITITILYMWFIMIWSNHISTA